MTERWESLTTVYTGLEADVLRTALEEQGIPVLVRGPGVGIFGSGFQGFVSGGIEILVPASALPLARESLPDM